MPLSEGRLARDTRKKRRGACRVARPSSLWKRLKLQASVMLVADELDSSGGSRNLGSRECTRQRRRVDNEVAALIDTEAARAGLRDTCGRRRRIPVATKSAGEVIAPVVASRVAAVGVNEKL